MYKQFATLLKSFGEILPKRTKIYQVLHHNRYILYSWVTFIKISIKSNNLLWYKSINIIYRSLQDVFGYKIIKLCIFSTNAKIYLFCKLNLNEINLKGPVKFKFYESTIATHSTIADSQHREFLTFLTSFSICCFSTTHIFLMIYVTLEAINCSIQAICKKTAPEVLRHMHLLLNKYTRASS